jgi:hypothetical protein
VEVDRLMVDKRTLIEEIRVFVDKLGEISK